MWPNLCQAAISSQKSFLVPNLSLTDLGAEVRFTSSRSKSMTTWMTFECASYCTTVVPIAANYMDKISKFSTCNHWQECLFPAWAWICLFRNQNMICVLYTECWTRTAWLLESIYRGVSSTPSSLDNICSMIASSMWIPAMMKNVLNLVTAHKKSGFSYDHFHCAVWLSESNALMIFNTGYLPTCASTKCGVCTPAFIWGFVYVCWRKC